MNTLKNISKKSYIMVVILVLMVAVFSFCKGFIHHTKVLAYNKIALTSVKKVNDSSSYFDISFENNEDDCHSERQVSQVFPTVEYAVFKLFSGVEESHLSNYHYTFSHPTWLFRSLLCVYRF